MVIDRLGWGSMARRTTIQALEAKRVMVTLKSGAGVAGIVRDVDGVGMWLAPAADEPVSLVPADAREIQKVPGEVYVTLANVEFVQVT